MNKKGALFQLVKSLNQAEKRYFKLFCTTLKIDSNYLKLFQEIDTQEIYDEKRIKEKFKGEKFIKELHVTKIYLSNLILKSLRNYYGKISKAAEIKDLLRDAEILFRKELYDQCYYTLEKVERLSKKYENYNALIEAVSIKRKLYLTRYGANLKYLNEVNETEKLAVTKLATINKYWIITTEISRFDDPQRSEPLLLSDPLPDMNESTGSLQACILHYHVLYSQEIGKNNSGEAEKNLNNLITLIEKYPHRIKDDPGSYINSLNNKVTFLIYNKRYAEALPLLEKIRNVPKTYGFKKENKFTIRMFVHSYNIELELYRDQKLLDEGAILIKEIKFFLERNEKSIPDDYFILLWNQFANLYFMRNEYSEALIWVNNIINIKTSDRLDLQRFNRILYLIIHFDLGNIVFLRYAIDNCRRFFKKHAPITPFEKICLSFFSKLSHIPKPDRLKVFERFYDQLFGSDKLLSPGDLLDYIDIKTWLEKKLKLT